MDPEILQLGGFLIGGLLFILAFLTENAKTKGLVASGIEVEGIVFDFEDDVRPASNAKIPIIRFVTKDGLWITKKYDVGFIGPFIKAGQKMKIFYDPTNPEEFVAKTPAFKWGLFLVLIAGIILLGIGLIKSYDFLTS